MTKKTNAMETDLRIRIGLKSRKLGKGRKRKQREIGVWSLHALPSWGNTGGRGIGGYVGAAPPSHSSGMWCGGFSNGERPWREEKKTNAEECSISKATQRERLRFQKRNKRWRMKETIKFRANLNNGERGNRW